MRQNGDYYDPYEPKLYTLGISGSSGELGQVRKREIVDIPLMYFDRRVTEEDCAKYKIGLQTRVKTGSVVFDTFELIYKSEYHGGRSQNVAYARLKFTDVFVSTEEQPFDYSVYITVDKARITDSGYAVSGVFSNYSNDADGLDNYINVRDTPVVHAKSDLNNICVDFGDKFKIYANMKQGEKYYGALSTNIKPKDQWVKNRHSNVYAVYYPTTIGLKQPGKIVKFDVDELSYIYGMNTSENLVYLGRTSEKVSYHDKYFLSSKMLQLPSSSSGSSGGGSSGNSYGGRDRSAAASTSSTVAKAVNASPLTKTDATKAVQSAVAAMGPNKIAVVRFNDKSTVSVDVAKAMLATANGKAIRVYNNTLLTNKKTVDIQVSYDPQLVTKDMNLHGSTTSNSAKAVKQKFAKFLKNDLLVLAFSEKETFGMPVEVAVKAVKGMDATNVAFYTYDSATNVYKKAVTPSYWIDQSGYIHFKTGTAGVIILSVGEFQKK